MLYLAFSIVTAALTTALVIQTVRVQRYRNAHDAMADDAIRRLGGGGVVVNGVMLPAPDNERWKKVEEGKLVCGVTHVYRSTVAARYHEVFVDNLTVGKGVDGITYVEAVFRAYQQRRALESLEGK